MHIPTQESYQNSRMFLTGLGIFLIVAGIFGIYMWQSGSDPDAWQSAGAFLGVGATLLFLFTRGKKV